jgi:positive phototaxis protein PixI
MFITEIMRCELTQIVPIFDVPNAVMGICNHRSEILWLVDLPYLLEIMPLYANSDRQFYNTMIISHEGRVAGFAVPNIKQPIYCNAANIQSLPLKSLPHRLGKCTDGIYRSPQGNDMLVINVNKLFDLLKINLTPEI